MSRESSCPTQGLECWFYGPPPHLVLPSILGPHVCNLERGLVMGKNKRSISPNCP